jgi:hypothetical protein
MPLRCRGVNEPPRARFTAFDTSTSIGPRYSPQAEFYAAFGQIFPTYVPCGIPPIFHSQLRTGGTWWRKRYIKPTTVGEVGETQACRATIRILAFIPPQSCIKAIRIHNYSLLDAHLSCLIEYLSSRCFLSASYICMHAPR